MASMLTVGVGADSSKLKADLAIAEAELKAGAKRLAAAGVVAEKTGDRTAADKAAADLEGLIKNHAEAKAAVVAAAAATSNLHSTTTGAFAAMSAGFGRMRDSMTPLKEHFKDLHEHVMKFGGALNNVVGNILPGFKDALAIGGILGGAALVSLVKSTADWGHELTTNAKILGITTSELKVLQQNARNLGVDPDVLVKSLLKFEDAMQKAVENQQKLGIEGAQIIEGKNAQINYGIANITKTASDSAAKVVNVAAVGLGQYQDQLRLMYTLTQKANDARGLPTESWDVFRVKAEAILRGTGKETDDLRDKLLKMGADLKAKNPFEALERSLPGFMGNLEKLGVSFIDPLTGRAKDLGQAWASFIEKFSKLDAFEQTRLGREMFGKQYFDSGIAKVLTQGVDEKGKAKPETVDELKAKLHEAHIQGSGFDPQVASAEKLWQTLRKVDVALSAIKKAFVLPFVEVFQGPAESMDKFLERVQTKVAEMSKSVALAIKPIADDLSNIFKGGNAQTDFGKSFVYWKQQATEFFTYVSTAFEKLNAVADGVASGLNKTFGTNFFTGKGILIALAVGKMTGAFAALTAGIKLTAVALALVYLNPWTIAITAIVAGAVLIYANWDKIWGLMQLIGGYISVGFVAAWNTAVEAIKIIWSGLYSLISGLIDRILSAINKMIDGAKSAANSIASLLGGGGGASAGGGSAASSALPSSGGVSGASSSFGDVGAASLNASGGYISGPGSGTSDSIPARLSNGEYVVNATSTSRFRPLLDHINTAGYAMGGLVGRALGFSPSIPSFAGGGLVGAGGGDTLNLSIGGQTFSGLKVPRRSTFDDLTSYARTEQRTSAGVKPSWHGR